MRSIFQDSSRFVQEYIGFHGVVAQEEAKRVVKRMEEAFYNDEIEFEGDGAMKWKVNGNYIPEECAEAMKYVDISKATPKQKRYMLNASIEATKEGRDRQTADFLERYREAMKNHVPSDEEMYEMRSAFEPGTKVVNVLTGQVYQL